MDKTGHSLTITSVLVLLTLLSSFSFAADKCNNALLGEITAGAKVGSNVVSLADFKRNKAQSEEKPLDREVRSSHDDAEFYITAIAYVREFRNLIRGSDEELQSRTQSDWNRSFSS